jgi:hypothetical protein
VRRALIHVAEHGLPGNHHFYITFRTNQKGVEIPQVLRERYPGEMTIVLQHQFWGLEVDENQFSATLSFSDVPHYLVVPFAAVTAFADPSVRFGLQFDVDATDAPGAGAGEAPAPLEDAADAAEGDVDGEDDSANDEEPAGGDKVVTLDAFRKK